MKNSPEGKIIIDNRVVKSYPDFIFIACNPLQQPHNSLTNLTLTGTTTTINATGNDLVNILTGNGGANILKGMGDNDSLFGNGGNDTLTGGLGVDYLSGGAGADKFRLESIAESGIDMGNRDIVTDFVKSQADKIDVSAIDANIATQTNNSFVWKGAAVFSGAAGELHYFYDIINNVTVVEGTVDANTTADFQVQLAGNIPLAATDFVL